MRSWVGLKQVVEMGCSENWGKAAGSQKYFSIQKRLFHIPKEYDNRSVHKVKTGNLWPYFP